MNITYLIGTLFAVGFMVIGMMLDGSNFVPNQIMNFFDPASIMITVGCTFAVVIASFPVHMLKSIQAFGHFDEHKKVRSHVDCGPTGGSGADRP